MRILIYIILIIISFNLSVIGQVKYSNDFLNIGIGAKNLAMANATVASIDDITAGYLNPAGLNSINKKWAIGVMHAEYFAGIANYDYLSTTKRIDNNSIVGASIIRLGVDGIQNTIDLVDADGNFDYDRITKFSVADYALILSYAKIPNIEGLKIGANSKIIYRNIGKFASAYGIGFDIGLQFKKNEWLLGATIHDVTTTFNVWTFNNEELEITIFEDSTFNQAPDNPVEITMPRLIAGVSRNFVIKEKFGISGEIDMEITTDGKRHTIIAFNSLSIDPKIGLEANYSEIVFLRFGIGNFQKVPSFDKEEMTFQPNFGLGIEFKNFTVDYALTDLGDQSIALYSHIFSLGFSF